MLTQGHLQVAQVLGLARIGVVVGEMAVDIAEEFDHLAAQGPKNGRGRGTGHAIARIDHDFQGAGQSDVPHDAVAVRGLHVGAGLLPPRAQVPIFGLDDAAQALDFVAMNGSAIEHHLEPVVVFRVVAARDLDAALALRAGGKIKLGGGDHAHVDDPDPRLHQALDERRLQRRSAQATVAPHRHHLLALSAGMGAKGTPERTGKIGVQAGRNHAPDVIGFEQAGGDFHAPIVGRPPGAWRRSADSPTAPYNGLTTTGGLP